MLKLLREAVSASIITGSVWLIPMVFLSSAYGANVPAGTGGIMTPAPDGEEAVRREYEGVVREGTDEAYRLFIRRHPDHPLADEARARLAR